MPEMRKYDREPEEALALANRVLDRHGLDPDGELCVLARQLIRRTEQLAKFDPRTFPMNCDLCNTLMNSTDDYDWHGIGNCVDICDKCWGNGWTEKPDA